MSSGGQNYQNAPTPTCPSFAEPGYFGQFIFFLKKKKKKMHEEFTLVRLVEWRRGRVDGGASQNDGTAL